MASISPIPSNPFLSPAKIAENKRTWVALGHVMLALGASRESVREIGPLYDDFVRLAKTVEELEKRLNQTVLPSTEKRLLLEAHSELTQFVDSAVDRIAVVAEEIVHALPGLGIRTEVFGYDQRALERWVRIVIEQCQSQDFSELNFDELGEFFRNLPEPIDCEIDPVTVTSDDIDAVVAVLQSIPTRAYQALFIPAPLRRARTQRLLLKRYASTLAGEIRADRKQRDLDLRFPQLREERERAERMNRIETPERPPATPEPEPDPVPAWAKRATALAVTVNVSAALVIIAGIVLGYIRMEYPSWLFAMELSKSEGHVLPMSWPWVPLAGLAAIATVGVQYLVERSTKRSADNCGDLLFIPLAFFMFSLGIAYFEGEGAWFWGTSEYVHGATATAAALFYTITTAVVLVLFIATRFLTHAASRRHHYSLT